MVDGTNWLRHYFQHNPGRLIHKWDHYFDVYERHLGRFRGRSPKVLEIGVYHGGSLEMWSAYFGRGSNIIGVDIEDRARGLAAPDHGITVEIGSQSDPDFLRDLVARRGPFDVVIDDGGHTMEQQSVSFRELWPAVLDGGEYVAEDLHTSYWEAYGGGLLREGTFIEQMKSLVDTIHAWHVPDNAVPVDDLTRSISGIHFYDSVVVLDKSVVTRPWTIRTGRPSFPLEHE